MLGKCVHWRSVAQFDCLIPGGIIAVCVFPVSLPTITKIILSRGGLWLRSHITAIKGKVWLYLLCAFQHITLNEPCGENNYSLIRHWRLYQNDMALIMWCGHRRLSSDVFSLFTGLQLQAKSSTELFKAVWTTLTQHLQAAWILIWGYNYPVHSQASTSQTCHTLSVHLRRRVPTVLSASVQDIIHILNPFKGQLQFENQIIVQI